MNEKNFKKIFLTAILALFQGASLASASEDVYQKMADDFAGYSAGKKVKSIAVLGFSRKAQTSREESEYVSEKLLAGLSQSGKVNLLERGQLDKVLEERKLELAGITQETPGGAQRWVNATDAVITGTVFGTAEHLTIIAKLIDPRTGAVLHIVEGEAERQPEMVPPEWSEDFYMPELGTMSPISLGKNFNLSFGNFRDAPAGLDEHTCGARHERLAVRQSAALEAKAKYWALKMKEPGFSRARLTKNPGGEIKDGKIKKRFYELLLRFYRSARAPQLSEAERNMVSSVMEEEGKISNECGML
ncbi:MAG TPA: hypothetical protein DCL44_01575 [Elusimicrobia bacterium]|nr:hypothetical protein [Elusimicrobiota bacterium]